jgi:hypothetical protein
MSPLRWALVSIVALPLAAATVHAQGSAESPAQFYLTYRATFDKAKTLDEVLPLMAKGVQSQFQNVAPADRPAALQLIKAMSAISNVRVVSETRSDQSATLVVEGIDSANVKNTGRVDLVRENGAWRLAGENWTAAPPK